MEGDDFLRALQGSKYVSDLVLNYSSGSVFLDSFECLAEQTAPALYDPVGPGETSALLVEPLKPP